MFIQHQPRSLADGWLPAAVAALAGIAAFGHPEPLPPGTPAWPTGTGHDIGADVLACFQEITAMLGRDRHRMVRR